MNRRQFLRQLISGAAVAATAAITGRSFIELAGPVGEFKVSDLVPDERVVFRSTNQSYNFEGAANGGVEPVWQAFSMKDGEWKELETMTPEDDEQPQKVRVTWARDPEAEPLPYVVQHGWDITADALQALKEGGFK